MFFKCPFYCQLLFYTLTLAKVGPYPIFKSFQLLVFHNVAPYLEYSHKCKHFKI